MTTTINYSEEYPETWRQWLNLWPKETVIDGLEMTYQEGRFLADSILLRPQFLEQFAQKLIDGEKMCPACLGFRGELYLIPERLVHYGLYWPARKGYKVCHYCLSEAATRRNHASVRRRDEEKMFASGVIVVSDHMKKFIRRPAKDLEPLPGVVYLIRAKGLVKIGATSRDVKARISQLGGQKRNLLLLTLATSAPFRLETFLHSWYIAKKANKGRDYFQLDESDISQIANIRMFDNNPVTVQKA